MEAMWGPPRGAWFRMQGNSSSQHMTRRRRRHVAYPGRVGARRLDVHTLCLGLLGDCRTLVGLLSKLDLIFTRERPRHEGEHAYG